MSADLTKMALRGLALSDAERAEKLSKASPEMREALEHEIGTINLVLACFLIWFEQGAADDVLDYLRSQMAWSLNAQAA